MYKDVSFIKLSLYLSNKKLIVSFVVTKEGRVRSPEIVRSAGNTIADSAVVNVIRILPDFIPGKHRGRYVNSYSAIPISFKYICEDIYHWRRSRD